MANEIMFYISTIKMLAPDPNKFHPTLRHIPSHLGRFVIPLRLDHRRSPYRYYQGLYLNGTRYFSRVLVVPLSCQCQANKLNDHKKTS